MDKVYVGGVEIGCVVGAIVLHVFERLSRGEGDGDLPHMSIPFLFIRHRSCVLVSLCYT